MGSKLLETEDSLVKIDGEVKVFGEIHAYYDGLMNLFNCFGSPIPDSLTEDIACYTYVFLGDFIDRGPQSLETITLLLFLKKYGG
jgi:hypothetical protein